jgi:hypothetical protein
MNNSNYKRLFVSVLIFIGIICLGLAIFARQLGLDNNDRWGAGRIILALAGGLVFAGAAVIQIQESIRNAFDRVAAALRATRFIHGCQTTFGIAVNWIDNFLPVKLTNRLLKGLANWWSKTAIGQYLGVSPIRPAKAITFVFIAGILLLYVWFISVGKMTSLPDPTFYNNMLADAFGHGQTNLLISPPKQLVDLANPYDFRQRENIGYLWDASLYNGKYYLYWGPVPALIVAGINSIVPVQIPDDALVFIFLAGLLIFTALLILAIWRRLFYTLPWWVIALPVLIAGLGNPVLWLVTRPSVYEAASAGGQFFLIGGLYWAFTGLDKPRPTLWKLALAGIFFTLAACTRTSLIAAIIVLSLLILWRAYRLNSGSRTNRAIVGSLLAIGLPLLLGGMAYGWYNYIRFGSILETGHRYQLTGMAMPPEYQFVTSIRYVIPNIYNYLFRPVTIDASFPFVIAPVVTDKMWPFFIHLPDYYYYSEPTAGILESLPYLWFAIIPMLWMVKQGKGLWDTRHSKPETDLSLERWSVLALSLTGLFTLAPILVFISSSMRYVEDAVPALVLLSTIGIWQAIRSLSGRRFSRTSLLSMVFIICLISIIFGLLLGISSHAHRFITYNQGLYDQLSQIFR